MDNKMIQATLPGMWERTITIGSAGKTFSVTGWKLGWAYGPANLMVNLQMVHQNCVYTGNTPIQVRLILSSSNLEIVLSGSHRHRF
jgi:kynurenine--oxoglutarate transaminase/cysteine-S-conjugate beta-lyase/glutamine--phenylpyruvate transaminase